jgi:DNA-binding CsgD family transcriptional regulator
MTISDRYSLFFRFLKKYTPTGFLGIDPDDPLLAEMEALMGENNQFFFVCDLIQVQILFTSKRSTEMIGVIPEDVTPYHFFEATHPDDIQRHNLGRSKLFGLAQGLYIAEKGVALISSNLRIRNPHGEYPNLLFQCYMYYTQVPVKTVYLIQLHSDISWCRKLKHGFHYYVGNDLSYFRYPDEKLLLQGNVFSEREFEIIQLIKSGLSSEQIAEKLFLSRHTVNTHRNNILEKTGKSSISDVIYELIERGLLQ